MEHTKSLTEAARILTERANDYGAPGDCFTRIATIASTILGRPVTRYEVSVILAATKMGRATESSHKADTWIDAINYLAFANEFVHDGEKAPAFKIPRPPVHDATSVRGAVANRGVAAVADALSELDAE